MNRLSKYLVALLSIFLAACVTLEHGSYQTIEPANVGDTSHHILIEKDATGFDKSIYWALYAGGPPTLDEAVKNILEKHRGESLRNVKITQEWWFIPLIWGEHKMVVQGEVWGAPE